MKHHAFFLVGLLLVLSLLSCTEETVEEKEIVRTVRYEEVLLSTGGKSRVFSGTSKAGTEAVLSFRVSGTLTSVNVKSGDPLSKGDLIGTIDDSDAQLTYDKAVVALEKSRVQKDTAKSTLDRVKGLYENNNVSLQEYEAAKTSYATANAAHDADKKNVDLQKRKLDYYKLYAPMAGIVSSVNAEKNENVRAGESIVVLNAGDDIEVQVGVPESAIANIQKGGKVTVKFSSIPGKIFDGSVSEVAFDISSQSSTYPVVVALSAPTSDIRPGMSADVTFDLGGAVEEATPKIIAPISAVGKGTTDHFVFVLNKRDGETYAAEKRSISVGELLPRGFEVTRGLSEGELVATAGVNTLMDGMIVRLLEQ
jgi:RND family efflux transporter MFP subunit